jgi:hypothetical protein
MWDFRNTVREQHIQSLGESSQECIRRLLQHQAEVDVE